MVAMYFPTEDCFGFVNPQHRFLFGRRIPVIHPANNLRKKAIRSLETYQIFLEDLFYFLTSFCSDVRSLGIQRADTFFMPKSSCKPFQTVVSDTLVSMAMKARSSIPASTDRPDFGSFCIESRPHRKCSDQNFIWNKNGTFIPIHGDHSLTNDFWPITLFCKKCFTLRCSS
jgi:hypothetical protein